MIKWRPYLIDLIKNLKGIYDFFFQFSSSAGLVERNIHNTNIIRYPLNYNSHTGNISMAFQWQFVSGKSILLFNHSWCARE